MDAADGDNRHIDRRGDFTQCFGGQMTGVVLGGGAEDRTYAQIIRTQRLCTLGGLDRVGR